MDKLVFISLYFLKREYKEWQFFISWGSSDQILDVKKKIDSVSYITILQFIQYHSFLSLREYRTDWLVGYSLFHQSCQIIPVISFFIILDQIERFEIIFSENFGKSSICRALFSKFPLNYEKILDSQKQMM